ncbi:MAG: hypothetical protein II837_05175 [Treponema sp.]|nr:hypothetical protein [Treponema sp.]
MVDTTRGFAILPSFIPPTFEEMDFDCRDCRHMFQGRDCKEGQQEMLTGPLAFLLSRFGLQGPKCPGCGSSRNTEKNPAVVY